ncbi:MAG: hypothetical protein EA393_06120 [Bacteroidetes bacterium]|nr:MAG: hypothetical protein EA393_06120 [Bacteroidota bacterium]
MFLIFCVAELSAQNEHNFILNTSLGYNYVYEDKAENLPAGWPSQLSDKEINDFKLSVAIGRKLRSNFYYGLGFSLNLRKDEWNPGVNKPRYDSGFAISFSTSNSVSQRSVFGPLAYFQYNLNLSEKSRFMLTLISQYDFEKNVDEHRAFVPGTMPGNDYFTTHYTTYESKRQYFQTGLVPGFRMNIYRNFGLDFTLGSMAYRIKTAESRLPDIKKSRKFAVGFKPENWTLGFHLTF